MSKFNLNGMLDPGQAMGILCGYVQMQSKKWGLTAVGARQKGHLDFFATPEAHLTRAVNKRKQNRGQEIHTYLELDPKTNQRGCRSLYIILPKNYALKLTLIFSGRFGRVGHFTAKITLGKKRNTSSSSKIIYDPVMVIGNNSSSWDAFFIQSNGLDCGYCAAHFLSYVLMRFAEGGGLKNPEAIEKMGSRGEISKGKIGYPKNPFAKRSARARLIAAYWASYNTLPFDLKTAEPMALILPTISAQRGKHNRQNEDVVELFDAFAVEYGCPSGKRKLFSQKIKTIFQQSLFRIGFKEENARLRRNGQYALEMWEYLEQTEQKFKDIFLYLLLNFPVQMIRRIIKNEKPFLPQNLIKTAQAQAGKIFTRLDCNWGEAVGAKVARFLRFKFEPGLGDWWKDSSAKQARHQKKGESKESKNSGTKQAQYQKRGENKESKNSGTKQAQHQKRRENKEKKEKIKCSTYEQTLIDQGKRLRNGAKKTHRDGKEELQEKEVQPGGAEKQQKKTKGPSAGQLLSDGSNKGWNQQKNEVQKRKQNADLTGRGPAERKQPVAEEGEGGVAEGIAGMKSVNEAGEGGVGEGIAGIKSVNETGEGGVAEGIAGIKSVNETGEGGVAEDIAGIKSVYEEGGGGVAGGIAGINSVNEAGEGGVAGGIAGIKSVNEAGEAGVADGTARSERGDVEGVEARERAASAGTASYSKSGLEKESFTSIKEQAKNRLQERLKAYIETYKKHNIIMRFFYWLGQKLGLGSRRKRAVFAYELNKHFDKKIQDENFISNFQEIVAPSPALSIFTTRRETQEGATIAQAGYTGRLGAILNTYEQAISSCSP